MREILIAKAHENLLKIHKEINDMIIFSIANDKKKAEEYKENNKDKSITIKIVERYEGYSNYVEEVKNEFSDARILTFSDATKKGNNEVTKIQKPSNLFGKHYAKIYLIIILLVLVYYARQTSLPTYNPEWMSCIDFLSKGQLYTGHPHCQEGPILFIIGLIFRSFFGAATAFHVSLKAFILSLGLLVAYLGYKIIKLETQKKGIFLAAFLFVIWLYGYLVTDTFDKSLTVAFTFIGFYFMYYSKVRFREIIAGAFFSLSIFSSIQSAILPVILLLYYPFEIGLIQLEGNGLGIKGVKIRLKKFKNVMLVIAPILVIFIVLVVIFPNMLAYSLFAHSLDPEFTLKQLLPLLAPKGSVNINLFFAYFVLGFSLYLFYHKKNVIPLVGSISLAIIMFAVAKTAGGFQISRYMIPAYPFIILTLVFLKEKLKDLGLMKAAFPVIFAMLVVFPGFETNDLSLYLYNKIGFELDNFQKEIGYGIHFMSPQEGRIMAEYPELLTRYDYKYNPEKTEIISDTFYHTNIDERVGPRLIKMGVADMSKWKMPILISESEEKQREFKIKTVSERLKQENYSMILVGPHMQDALIYKSFMSLDDQTASRYCKIIVPNAEHYKRNSRHTAMVVMDNAENCRLSFQKMVYYYSEVFDDICGKSIFAANNIINGVLQMNGIALQKQCTKGGNFIEDYNEYVFFPMHWIFLLMMIAVILIAQAPLLSKQNLLKDRRHKVIYYGIISVLVILSIAIYFSTMNESTKFLEIARNIQL